MKTVLSVAALVLCSSVTCLAQPDPWCSPQCPPVYNGAAHVRGISYNLGDLHPGGLAVDRTNADHSRAGQVPVAVRLVSLDRRRIFDHVRS